MDPRTFLAVAIELARGKTPAHLRSSTSRAYYAAFNSGAELLRDCVPISKGAGAHGEVQNCLLSSGDRDAVLAGRNLRTLHSRRIRADYRLDVSDPEQLPTVEGVLTDADETIRLLDSAFKGAKGNELRTAIQKYWRDVLRKPL